MASAKPLLLFTIAAIVAAVASGAVEYRTFTDKDGQKIQARIIDVRGSTVKLEVEGSGIYDVPVAILSETDQTYVKEWEIAARTRMTADCRFSVRFIKRRDESYDGTDYDNQTQIFIPGVEIDNEELNTDFAKVEGVLLIIGESVFDKDYVSVIAKEKFSLSIPAGEKRAFTGTRVTNQFDDNDNEMFGYPYCGYVILLKNDVGDLVYAYGSKSAWAEKGERLWDYQTGLAYDSDLERSLGTTDEIHSLLYNAHYDIEE